MLEKDSILLVWRLNFYHRCYLNYSNPRIEYLIFNLSSEKVSFLFTVLMAIVFQTLNVNSLLSDGIKKWTQYHASKLTAMCQYNYLRKLCIRLYFTRLMKESKKKAMLGLRLTTGWWLWALNEVNSGQSQPENNGFRMRKSRAHHHLSNSVSTFSKRKKTFVEIYPISTMVSKRLENRNLTKEHLSTVHFTKSCLLNLG